MLGKSNICHRAEDLSMKIETSGLRFWVVEQFRVLIVCKNVKVNNSSAGLL